MSTLNLRQIQGFILRMYQHAHGATLSAEGEHARSGTRASRAARQR